MTADDAELLSAHPGFSEVQDGIDHLDGSGCMWSSAEAIRLLDAQNGARGREIDRLTAERDRWRTAFEDLHARIHRDFNFDAGESAPPQGDTALRMMDDLVTYADECHPEIKDLTR